jgi:sugar O-acyltransferase (sialic acid O-acetyltransferase NeuD family)
MKKLLMVGSAGHAASVVDVVERMGGWEIAGLMDNDVPSGTTRLGYEVVGKPEGVAELAHRYGIEGLLVAVGDNWSRFQVAGILRAAVPRLPFVTAVHPTAVIGKNATIGPGTVVMAGAVINTNCRIGSFCIVNTRASLDHDGVLADYASLAPGVTAGGSVAIGEFSAICIGATIAHKVRIGKQTVVGAGSTVLRDLGDGLLAHGTPARRIRERGAGEVYLR